MLNKIKQASFNAECWGQQFIRNKKNSTRTISGREWWDLTHQVFDKAYDFNLAFVSFYVKKSFYITSVQDKFQVYLSALEKCKSNKNKTSIKVTDYFKIFQK